MHNLARMGLLTLSLGCGALSMSQAGCTSQRAITIFAIDAATAAEDTAPALPDAPDAGPEAQAPFDVIEVADSANPLDAPDARPDTPDTSDGAPLDTRDAFDALSPLDNRDAFDGLLPPDTRDAFDGLSPLDTRDAPLETSSPDVAKQDTAPQAADTLDTSPPAPVTLFSDEFAGGYEVNWALSESSDGPVTNTRDDTNAVVTLDSSKDDFSRLRCNLSGEKFTATDITASMSLRVDLAPSSTRTVRLDVRQALGTANIFYAVGAVVTTDGAITKVSIFKKVPDGAGDYTICELAAGPTLATKIAMNQWRTIKLKISGTTSVRLAAFLGDLEVATYEDDCTSPLTATNGAVVDNAGCLADQTGLGLQVEKGLKASIDDVLVTTP